MRFKIVCTVLGLGLTLFGAVTDELGAALARAGATTLRVGGGACPGSVFAVGEQARVLAWGRCEGGAKVGVAACTTAGRGRVVAVTHGAFHAAEVMGDPSNQAFYRTVFTWLGTGPVYLDGDDARLRALLASVQPMRAVKVFNGYRALAQLPSDAVVVTHPDNHSIASARLLTDFVRRGGGVLCTVVGWGWHQISDGESFKTQSRFNLAMGPLGLYTGNQLVDPVRGRCFTVIGTGTVPALTVPDAFACVARGKLSAEDAQQGLATLGALMEFLPDDEKVCRGRLRQLANGAHAVVPSPAHPLGAENLSARLSLLLFTDAWRADPEKNWPAHPAAVTYPGLPAAGTPRVTRTVPVNLAVPRWHSTGLFAVAGEPLTIRLSAEAARLGLRVRVGATTCDVRGHASWKRAPTVDIELPLTKTATTFASPFGGLVSIVVPHGRKGSTSVEIGPACAAPHFVLGRDTAETWRATLRSLPAPMAEIESERIVLSVPSARIRTLDDPQPLLQVWKEIMDQDARLTGIAADRSAPERMSVDVQLCCGYMHSGYPIMIPDCAGAYLVSEPEIRKGEDDNVWGFFHEMGHNHQNDDWTFNDTTEVTVNFFTLYNMEHICGKMPRQTKMGSEGLKRRVAQWNANGRSFAEWNSDPFLALDFFVRLREKYGWEPFVKMFREYRTCPASERPKSDAEKRLQWCRRFSRIVGEDLTKEFQFMLP